MSREAEERIMPEAFVDLNEQERREERMNYRDILIQRYLTQHQSVVLGIRSDVAAEVRHQLETIDQVELGRRILALMINREIDERTLRRLPGEAYASVIASQTTDLRAAWSYDSELRDITTTAFGEPK